MGANFAPAAVADRSATPTADAGASTSSLRLDSICKQYGSFGAVKSVSLEVRQGEFVTLLGPSGSGKTTTLMMIAGFVDPSSGRIYVDGRDVTEAPPHRRNIGMVFQNYALFPHLTVFKNVAFPLDVRKLPAAEVRARTMEALDIVKLADLGDRYPTQLSGGQQQRVALARAIVFRPPLLLMDEPLGALDKKLREQMQTALMDLHRTTGMTMIYVTHDQEEALSMSNRVAVMRAGRLVQYDTPAGLYYDPAQLYVCRFVGRTNVLRGKVERVAGDAVVASGGLTATASEQLQPGMDCAVCVRPERVRIVQEERANGAANALAGRVLERVFFGQTTSYVVELDRGGRVEVSAFSESLEAGAAAGDRVVVSFAPESGRVFAAGDEELA